MSRIIKPTLIFIAIFLFPAVASAVDMDFYTYGGFQPVVDAFTQLTMIFGDSSYQAFYYVAVVCGIGCGATAAYIMLIGGRGSNLLGWAPIAALGIAIYIGLFVPKGNLVVYDPVFNKFQTVPNVPDGVVIVAGSLNAIEQALVNIVSNSSSPTAYQTQAGGIGYMALYNLTTQPATASSSFLDMNLNRYVQDCVSFALNNPASGLTVDELRKTTTNFATSFAKAANPAIMTVYYSSAAPQGVPQACNVDWTQISTIDMTAAALQNNINAACSTVNYDVTDAVQLAQCQTNMINLAQSGNLTTGDINSLMQQIYLYNRLDQYFQSGNTTAITNYNFLMNAAGSMQAAQEWIPILKAALTAIAVALIPFLCIFIPTPICGRALNLMFGMFLWLAIWGLCDAIMHQFAVTYANNVWDDVRNYNLGMDALYFFPNMTVKALGMFGTLRLGGLLLATALTTMLTKFGGSVMGMLAGNITGQIQGAGTSAEWKTTDPSGRAQSIDANTRALPTEAWAASYSLSNRGGEAYSDKSGKTQAYETMASNFGGPNGVAGLQADAIVGRTVGFGAQGKAMQELTGGLPEAFGNKTFGAKTELSQLRMTNESYGGDHNQLAAVKSASERALPQIANDINSRYGLHTTASDIASSTAQFNAAMGFEQARETMSLTGAGTYGNAGLNAGEASGFGIAEKLAHSQQVRSAASIAAPYEWQCNSELWDKSRNQLTDKGVDTFIAATQGGVNYATKYGAGFVQLDSGGNSVRWSEHGTIPANDREGLNALADKVKNSGHPYEANALRAQAGHAVEYDMSGDTRGNISGFAAGSGGSVTFGDKGLTDRGRENDYTNLNKSTTGSIAQNYNVDTTNIEKGLRSDIGDKSRTGDLVTQEHFHGNVDGHNFTNATAEIRGNTFSVYGETADGRWETVSGYTSKDAAGNRRWTVMKGRDDSGMSFTPQAAMDSVLNKHSVPESAMKDYQTKMAFAGNFVDAMQQLRSESSTYSKESSLTTSLSTRIPRTGRMAGSGGIGSLHTGMQQENINTQFRETMKILDKHENTPEGRRATADELLKLYDDNASNSSDRLMHFFHGGAWERKK